MTKRFEGVNAKNKRLLREIKLVGSGIPVPVNPPITSKNKKYKGRHKNIEPPVISETIIEKPGIMPVMLEESTVVAFPDSQIMDEITGDGFLEITTENDTARELLLGVEQDVAVGSIEQTGPEYNEKLLEHMVKGTVTPDAVFKAISRGIHHWGEQYFPHRNSRGKER